MVSGPRKYLYRTPIQFVIKASGIRRVPYQIGYLPNQFDLVVFEPSQLTYEDSEPSQLTYEDRKLGRE